MLRKLSYMSDALMGTRRLVSDATFKGTSKTTPCNNAATNSSDAATEREDGANIMYIEGFSACI